MKKINDGLFVFQSRFPPLSPPPPPRETILPLPRRGARAAHTACQPIGWTNASGGPYDEAAPIVKEENWVLDPRRKPTASP